MPDRNNKQSTGIIAFSLLAFIIIVGVSGYSILGFTFTEAFFMTIITIATVGFKEVHDLDPAGMWFTSVLIIVSFGIFAYVATTFGRYLIDGIFSNYYRDRNVKRKINKLKDHVVICGFGRNGKQAAIELAEHKFSIIVIENDTALVEEMRNSDMLYIEGDATREEVLKEANIQDAKAMITT
jgi:voltage-gated potassium channel